MIQIDSDPLFENTLNMLDCNFCCYCAFIGTLVTYYKVKTLIFSSGIQFLDLSYCNSPISGNLNSSMKYLLLIKPNNLLVGFKLLSLLLFCPSLELRDCY